MYAVNPGGKPRQRAIKPFVQQLMRKHKCETLAELGRKLGLNRGFLDRAALEPEAETDNPYIRFVENNVEAAHKSGVSVDVWFKNLYGISVR